MSEISASGTCAAVPDTQENERENARNFDRTFAGQNQLWQRLLGYMNDQKYILRLSHIFQEDISKGYGIIQKRRGIPVTQRTLDEVSAMYDMTDRQFIDKLLINKKVLDIGCGKSTLYNELKERCEKTNLFSVDISKEVFQENMSTMHVVGSALSLPFSGESFDTVLATICLPFWARSKEEVDMFLSESLRVLKKGGTLCISPISQIESRPSLPIGEDEISSMVHLGDFLPIQSRAEKDLFVISALRDLQMHTISRFEEYRNNGSIAVYLGDAYVDIPEQYNVEMIKSYPPSFAFLVK